MKIAELTNRLIKLEQETAKTLEEGSKVVDYAKGLAFPNSNKITNHPDALRIIKNVALTDRLARLTWNEDFEIEDANDHFLMELGYTLEEIKGKKLFNNDGTSDFMTDDTLEDSAEAVEENLANGVTWVSGIVNKWKAKDGREVEIDWQIGFNDNETGIGSAQCLFLTK